MKTILGTGQLGLTIMETLLRNNPTENILLVNKQGRLNINLPKNVKLIGADVTNKQQLENIARESEVIFSCTDVPYQLWAEFYPAAASALAFALEQTSAKLVFADNLYSYGNVRGQEMTESMSHTATSKKGQIRASVIKTLLQANKTISNRVAFVKAADFIGPRIHKGVFSLNFLERLHQEHTIMLAGSLLLPHTFTYIRDFATAMINVGTANDTFGQIWHVPNAPALNLNQWIKHFEAETGKKAKVMILPKFVVRLAGLFDPLLKELYELAYQFEYPYLVSHHKYVSRFGNHYTNHLTIIQETLQWYQSLQKTT
ncbi:NAD-dependent epimerase/dehydratase family protein [Emticicia sp. 17c]|uniref:NAD-dependent epimerase/dehydratase family protein n=1 Tax=Emticicia sp. 17c TaxID=3127704 RepID=UPI00301DBC2E